MNGLMIPLALAIPSWEITDLTVRQHAHAKRDSENMLIELGEDASKFGRIYHKKIVNGRPCCGPFTTAHFTTKLTMFSQQKRIENERT